MDIFSARPTAIDLFCGAGGASLGMTQAGYRVTLGVDSDLDAVMTLRASGHVEQVANSFVQNIDWPMKYLHGGSPDLLWASPPCQRWSRATTRTRDDHIDYWPETLKVIRWLTPKRIIIENVKGAPMEEWAKELERIRILDDEPQILRYHTEVVTIDAARLGCGQTRVRKFLFAWRKGAGRPDLSISPVSAYHSMSSALPQVHESWAPRNSEGELVYPRDGSHGRAGTEPWRLASPAPAVTCQEVRGTRASASSGWTFHGGPDRASDAAFLAVGIRRLSVRSCARLQGFPDTYPWQGTSESVYKQIGNAVIPSVAEWAARAWQR